MVIIHEVCKGGGGGGEGAPNFAVPLELLSSLFRIPLSLPYSVPRVWRIPPPAIYFGQMLDLENTNPDPNCRRTLPLQ